MALKAILQ